MLMSLEGFVQTAGAAMGLARESFYRDFGIGEGGGVGLSSASQPSATLTAAFSGSGQAALAADNESNFVNGQGSPLSAQDLATNVHLDSTVAAAQAGRSQMDSVIAAALADIKSLAAQPVALVQALGGHLENTRQKLTNGQANASTCTATTLNHVAAYNGLGCSTGGGVGLMSAAGVTSQAGGVSSMGTLSSTAMMAAMAGSAAATSAANTQRSSTSQPATLLSATTTQNPDQAEITNVVNRAKAQVAAGVMYSWGGGGPNGPTLGLPNTSGANTVGFDCSGLVQYAYAPYIPLPRTSELQYNVGTPVTPTSKYIQAGDLIFMNWGEGGVAGPGHVMLAISPTQAAQASETGFPLNITTIPTSGIAVKRILGAGVSTT